MAVLVHSADDLQSLTKIATPLVECDGMDVGDYVEYDGGFVMGKTVCLDIVHF